MEVSLEIVPHAVPLIQQDAAQCRFYPAISCINIPDLPRFSIRSWEGCAAVRAAGKDPNATLIPHLRARDFTPDEPFPLTGFFREQEIHRVLVIAGDPVPGQADKGGDRSTIDFIKKIKAELPELEVYAAFDPYRTNIRYELDYLEAKEAAGAVGFMSQPFFDLRLLEIYAEFLEGKNVFWGTSPVLTKGNQRYWESRNRAVFPRSFRPDLIWNVGFARSLVDFCSKNRFNLYLMPINLDLKTYLSSIWPASEKPEG